jgi:hypothetical protein
VEVFALRFIDGAKLAVGFGEVAVDDGAHG